MSKASQAVVNSYRRQHGLARRTGPGIEGRAYDWSRSGRFSRRCRRRLRSGASPNRDAAVGTIAELFGAAETLALTREQIGDRLAILTNGAVGVLATDALMAPGGHLARLSKETISASDRLLPRELEPRQSSEYSRRRVGDSATLIRSLC